MRPSEKLSITLPADMVRLVREKVRSGTYASNSEVIREALRLWQERETLRAERLGMIRAKLVAALDDPRASLTDEELGRELDKVHAATIKARGDAA